MRLLSDAKITIFAYLCELYCLNAMKVLRNIFLTFMALSIAGCTFLNADQTVVAKVGRKKLYSSEVIKYIPAGLPKQDSLALAQQYIKAWASELIINEMADMQLSKSERDVTKELEEYKSSLLKYRYEQRYIAEHLDTAVTSAQIEEHYLANPNLYELNVPIAKARYLRIPQTSPMKDKFKKMMASEDEDELFMLDSLSYSNASKYTTYRDKWVDMVTIARDFGTDYGTLIASIKDSYIDIIDEQGVEHIAYLIQYIPSGKVPPLDYCTDKIREVIVSQRKYVLSSNLERDLLQDAIKKGNFVIYENNEE